MSSTRRGPGEPEEPSRPRRRNDTDAAIDDLVGAAASEVERTLAADGIAEQRVMPRDALGSRYPFDTIDEEAATEQFSGAEVVPRSLATPFPPARGPHPPSGTTSLSPLAMDPRASSAPPAAPSRPGPHARRAALSGRGDGARTLRFFPGARRGRWVLFVGMLGGLVAFTAVMVMRSPGAPEREPARDARAAASPLAPDAALVDAGSVTRTAPPASADASTKPPPPPRRRH